MSTKTEDIERAVAVERTQLADAVWARAVESAHGMYTAKRRYTMLHFAAQLTCLATVLADDFGGGIAEEIEESITSEALKRIEKEKSK